MSKNKYTLSIYDTISGKFVDVDVTKELYDAYRRMTWNIEKSDQVFNAHEIQMSTLDWDDGETREYPSNELTPLQLVENAETILELYEALSMLETKDVELIRAIYFAGKTQGEFGAERGESQQSISAKKFKIFKKLREFFKKRL